jgi:hypothetical protein
MDYAYTYNYDYSPELAGGILAFLGAWLFVILLVAVFFAVCKWRIFEKAGRKGWESIIPIYNIVIEMQMLDMPMWMLILLIIPGVNVAVPIIIAVKYAERFGKESAYALGLIFLPFIFYPMLAFGKSTFNK